MSLELFKPHDASFSFTQRLLLNVATYVANINKATEGKPEVDILELQLNALEAGPAVRNNGGGHYNHAVSSQVRCSLLLSCLAHNKNLRSL
jgi:Fe-Mn family superoxide dismutase